MSLIQSIILGLIQGITEFLPISSSGHLVLVSKILNLEVSQSIPFAVFINTATLLAVIYCFRKDIKNIFTKELLPKIILATIPAAFVGFFWAGGIEEAFYSSGSVAWALLLGSLLMFVADKANAKWGNANVPLNNKRGFIIGVFQALALVPGFSRSGTTISGGLLSKLSREEAIRFSFLLYIPVSLGALLKILMDLGELKLLVSSSLLPSLVAFASALISGIWAAKFVLRYLSKNSFKPFIIYRIILALLIFIFL